MSQANGILIIIDGWGIGEKSKTNPVYRARTPFFDSLNYKKIVATGPRVGMPEEAMGSTAVGHEVMSGVDYEHPMLRVKKEIVKGRLKNKVFDPVLKSCARKKSSLHLMGLVSSNREHSDISHLYAIMRRALEVGVKKIKIHFFSDGRGTPPFSAVSFADDLLENGAIMTAGQADVSIAAVGGRDITMNRSRDSWEKSVKTYRAIIEGKAEREKNIFKALKDDYEKGITDQYIKLRVLGDYRGAEDGDCFLHFNFRKDRAQMLMQLLTEKESALRKITGIKNFKKLKYRRDLDYSTLNIAGLVQYYSSMKSPAAYPDTNQKYSLGSMLEDFNYIQYRISGPDKTQAVELLSGGSSRGKLKNEKRIVVPYPRELRNYITEYEKHKGEKGYELDPYEKYPCLEIKSLRQKTREIIEKAREKTFIIVNIANPDMVGHTGNFESSVKAAEAVDRALEDICAAAEKRNMFIFITSDHGNLEISFTEDGDASTFHSRNPVPFAVLPQGEFDIEEGGCLRDVAPTILSVMEPERSDEIKNKLKGEIIVKEKSAISN